MTVRPPPTFKHMSNVTFQAPTRFGGKSHCHSDFQREKNNSKAESLVYIYVNNRERARTRDTKQRRRISMEQQHENYIAAGRR